MRGMYVTIFDEHILKSAFPRRKGDVDIHLQPRTNTFLSKA